MAKFKFKDKVILNGKIFNAEYNNVKGIIIQDEYYTKNGKVVYDVGLPDLFKRVKVTEDIISLEPLTNGEWLKGLSYTELNLLIDNLNYCENQTFSEPQEECYKCPLYTYCHGEWDIADKPFLEWLKQPHKEKV